MPSKGEREAGVCTKGLRVKGLGPTKTHVTPSIQPFSSASPPSLAHPNRRPTHHAILPLPSSIPSDHSTASQISPSIARSIAGKGQQPRLTGRVARCHTTSKSQTYESHRPLPAAPLSSLSLARRAISHGQLQAICFPQKIQIYKGYRPT